MKPALTILFVLLLMTLGATAYGYDYLRVQDPRTGWSSAQGTIDQAILEVRPKGIYMEQSLFLTFSARSGYFTASDTLEITFFFDLPEHAMVTDLWLWIENEPVQAKIMDSWRASSIYEGIVRRRRDPAILFKRSATQYELRIFPMAGNQTRKIKLTYLSPTRWTNKSVASSLPTNLLRTSSPELESLSLLVWPHDEWIRPRVPELASLQFNTVTDTLMTTHVEASLPKTALQGSLTLAFDSPMRNGTYLSTRGSGNEGWFQLAFTPSLSLKNVPGKKVAVMVDYDAANSSFNQTTLLAAIRNALHQSLVPADSFNVILGRLSVVRASEHWLPADSATIDSAIAGFGPNPLGGYSNLPAVLTDGVEFIKEQGHAGSLLLLANSDEAGAADYTTANRLLNDVIDLMGEVIPLSVADFGDLYNYSYYYIGDKYYRGNEYLYVNLTRLTGGSYSVIGSAPVTEFFADAMQTMSEVISSFDLHTTLQNGFCYGRMTLGGLGLSVPVDKPILQVGKYYGSLPFIIQAAGVYNSTVYSETVEIPAGQAAHADSLLGVSWAGMQIADWETEDQSNELTAMIVDQSLKNRILSRYTAFLALEVNDTTVFCASCRSTDVGPIQVTGVETDAKKDSSATNLVAYPNPFNATTVIKGRLPVSALRGSVSLKIYNILGQVVRTFDAGLVQQDGKFSISWDGRNDNGVTTTSGMYIFVMTTPTSRQALKLLMVK